MRILRRIAKQDQKIQQISEGDSPTDQEEDDEQTNKIEAYRKSSPFKVFDEDQNNNNYPSQNTILPNLNFTRLSAINHDKSMSKL